jgi:DNA polymerase-3 subunit epsilon
MKSKKKILWIDTETTGLDPTLHSIIQIGGVIDIDGEEKEIFEMKCKPHPDFAIDNSAIAVNKLYDYREFPEMRNMHKTLCDTFSRYVDKFDRDDKFIIAGQNIKFDLDMLAHFFMRLGDNYLGSYVDFRKRIELYDITNALQQLGIIKSESLSLPKLCEEFEIEYTAHDALSDIVATRDIYYNIIENLSWGKS